MRRPEAFWISSANRILFAPGWLISLSRSRRLSTVLCVADPESQFRSSAAVSLREQPAAARHTVASAIIRQQRREQVPGVLEAVGILPGIFNPLREGSRPYRLFLAVLTVFRLVVVTELLQTRPGVAWRAHRYGLFRFPELVERPR